MTNEEKQKAIATSALSVLEAHLQSKYFGKPPFEEYWGAVKVCIYNHLSEELTKND